MLMHVLACVCVCMHMFMRAGICACVSVLGIGLDLYGTNDFLLFWLPITTGTYFCCSTHSLVVRVIGKKKISNPDPDAASFMYYITDGVYGSFNMVLHGVPPRVPPVVIRVWASFGLL